MRILIVRGSADISSRDDVGANIQGGRARNAQQGQQVGRRSRSLKFIISARCASWQSELRFSFVNFRNVAGHSTFFRLRHGVEDGRDTDSGQQADDRYDDHDFNEGEALPGYR